MTTTKLQLDYDYDFLLIGILSSLPDYKLCWKINKLLGISLAKEKDIELQLFNKNLSDSLMFNFETPDMSPRFSMYQFYEKVHHITYRIVANKSNSSLLIKEEQSVDFFFLIEGFFEDWEKEEAIINGIREQKEIITAYKIDPNKLKSKQNLIFE